MAVYYQVIAHLTEHAKAFGINNLHGLTIDSNRIELFNDDKKFANLTLLNKENNYQKKDNEERLALESKPLDHLVMNTIHSLFSGLSEENKKQEIKNLTPKEKLALMITIINAISETCSNINRFYEQDLKSTFDAVMAIMVRKN
ncbi:hypothetical protein [Arsenophonus nasoniae]|uniref:hypothetical protein n=1 Tax=Arsenophonus nasoniae TaxID=638 RepID=UPI00387942ED